jgi:hypothetical protein
MMTIKKFMEIINYKINEVSQYMWQCYGHNAQILDSYRKDGSLEIVFDLENQTLYEFSVCDYKLNKAYKWINPKFVRKHNLELKKRGFPVDQAWDDVNYEPTSSSKLIAIAKKVSSKK